MREVGVVYRAGILLLGWLHLYWLHTEVSHNTTTSTHVPLTVLSHHSALHKDAMLYNGIVPGTLGLTRGLGPEAP